MKRLFGILAMAMLIATLLVPVAAASAEGYDLVFWVYSDWMAGKQNELLVKWIDEFVASHDQVNSITMIGKNDTELKTGAMAGVGLPDIYCGSFRDGLTYYESVNLLDLMPYYEKTDDQYKNGWMPEAIDIVQVDGGMWALPYMSYIPIIFRNLDVIEACGIDPSEPLKTWDEFIDQCKRITEAGYSATHKWSGVYYTAGAIMAAEPTLTPGFENGATTITPEQLIPTFEVIKALSPYTTTLSYSDEATKQAFYTNKIAFVLDGPWNVEGYDNSGVNYDILAVPGFTEDGKNGGLRGWDAIYGVDSGDKARNEMIAEFMLYITNTENQSEWVSYNGRPVLRQDAMDSEGAQATEIGRVSAEAQKGGANQMDFFHSTVFWPTTIADISELVAGGSMEPADAANAMVDAINAMYIDAGE